MRSGQAELTQLDVRHRIYLVVWLAVITLAFVTPAVTGIIGMIASVILLLGVGLDMVITKGITCIFKQPLALMCWLAFGLIALAFIITARTPHDASYIFNFLGLTVAAPMLFLSRRFSGPVWTRRIILLAAIGAIITCAVSTLDILVLDRNRAAGMYIGGANRLGQIALLLGLICTGGMIVVRERWPRALLLLAAVLCTLTIIMTGSRGVVIASIPALLLAVGFATVSKPSVYRVSALLLFLVVATLGAVWAASVADHASVRILQMFDGIRQVAMTGHADDNNVQVRLDLYGSAVESFRSSPLFGVGWKQSLETASAAVFADDTVPPFFKRNDFAHMHSDMLGLAASAGVFGVMAWLLMVAAPWTGLGGNDGYKRLRLYYLLSGICVFHVYALTDVSLIFDISLEIYVYFAALIAGTFVAKPDVEISAA